MLLRVRALQRRYIQTLTAAGVRGWGTLCWQEKYDGPLITQLREPMMTLLQKGNTIDQQHEEEDEEDAALRSGEVSPAEATKSTPAASSF